MRWGILAMYRRWSNIHRLMSTNELSPEQIATAVSQAEDLAREGRYEEAGDCAIAILPEITTDSIPIDLERNRLKLRIYHVLHACPGMEFVDTDHEEMSYLLGKIFGDQKKLFSPSEIVRAHILSQVCNSSTDPKEKAQHERREFEALEAAQKVLETEKESPYEKALAHFLICMLTPDEAQEEDHFRQFFALRKEERPMFATVNICCNVLASTHLHTGLHYLDRAIKEFHDVPQDYTRLLCTKVHTRVMELVREPDSKIRGRWYQDHEEELHGLVAEIFMNPDSSARTMILTHLSLCHYALAHQEFTSAKLHIGVAEVIAREQDPRLLQNIVYYRDMLSQREEEEENEEDGDWWKHGGEAPV